MFDYLQEITRFMDIKELWIMSDIGLQPEIKWQKRNSFTTTRYVRE